MKRPEPPVNITCTSQSRMGGSMRNSVSATCNRILSLRDAMMHCKWRWPSQIVQKRGDGLSLLVYLTVTSMTRKTKTPATHRLKNGTTTANLFEKVCMGVTRPLQGVSGRGCPGTTSALA